MTARNFPMNYKLYLASLFFVPFLFSCEENEASGPGANAARSSSASPAPVTIPTSNTILPVNEKLINTSTPAKLNPAHGQPGHNCDIAVGAPLSQAPSTPLNNSQPASPILNTSVQTSPNTQANPVAAPSVNTGLNPAHGQPGHRCDVGVGDPLPKNSAPAQNTPTPNSPLFSSPAEQNVDNAPQQAATPNTPGLNPAHGQPGHRCDIAVGQPLNEQAKKK